MKINAAKYFVKLYETPTGNPPAEKSFELIAETECPPLEFFSETEKTRETEHTQSATDFLKPSVKH